MASDTSESDDTDDLEMLHHSPGNGRMRERDEARSDDGSDNDYQDAAENNEGIEQRGNDNQHNGPELEAQENGEENNKKKKKQRSWVWSHCRKENGVPVCEKCGFRFSKTASTSTIDYHLLNVDHINPPNVTAASKPKLEQPKLPSFGVHSQKNKPYYRAITKKIAEWIAGDMLPTYIVHGRGFRKLMAFLVPGYVVPHRVTLTRKYFFI